LQDFHGAVLGGFVLKNNKLYIKNDLNKIKNNHLCRGFSHKSKKMHIVESKAIVGALKINLRQGWKTQRDDSIAVATALGNEQNSKMTLDFDGNYYDQIYIHEEQEASYNEKAGIWKCQESDCG